MGAAGMTKAQKAWGTWAKYPYTEDELNAAKGAHAVARRQVDGPAAWHELDDQIKDGFLAMAQEAIRGYESSDNGTRAYWTKLAMDTRKMLDEVIEQRDLLQNEVRGRQDRENGTVGTKAERDMLSAWRTMLYDVDVLEKRIKQSFPSEAIPQRRAVWSAMLIIDRLRERVAELEKRLATERKRHESSERNTERQRTREVREELRRLSVELTLRDCPVPVGTKVVDHALAAIDGAIPRPVTTDREHLGRAAWDAWEQFSQDFDKPRRKTTPWEDLGEFEREGYRRIGERIAKELSGVRHE